MRQHKEVHGLHPTVTLWVAVGLIGFAVLPWYGTDSNFFTLSWLLDGYPFDGDVAPALFLALQGEKPWLAPVGLLLLVPFLLWNRQKNDPFFGRLLIAVGAIGFAYLMLQGFAIGLRGWRFEWLTALFGELGDRQFGMGYGAMLCAGAFLFLFSVGLAGRGVVGGDVFVVSTIAFVITVVALFIFMPILQMLANAMITQEGTYSLSSFVEKIFSERLWGIGCVTQNIGCGVAWNSLFLAILV
ncbi:MAG: iron ABC transporter permease, partial [Alphaproteobacteria bacterium]|nr:iron ABC transporter permease [Alphaproteobacteria bacterium]